MKEKENKLDFESIHMISNVLITFKKVFMVLLKF